MATPRIPQPRRPTNVPVAPGLREQFEAEVVRAFEAAPDRERFRASQVVGPFLQAHGHEVSQSRLYGWAAEMRASGVLDRSSPRQTPLPRQGKAGDGTRGELVPPRSGSPQTAFAVADHLSECVQAAQEVMAAARRSRHSAENAKLLITASEHLRRVVDSIVRLQENIFTIERINRFHEAVIETVRAECPAAAVRIYAALEALSAAWADGHAGPPAGSSRL